MCIIIGVYVSLYFKESFNIIVDERTISGNMINSSISLNEILSNNTVIKFSPFTKNALKKISEMIGFTHANDFISLYEKACKYLKIKEKNMVMTLSRYENLIHAIKN